MVDSQQPSLFQSDEASPAQSELNGMPTQENGKKPRKMQEPLTSKQQLAATIKSVRDLLRKDAGLSGDTDRLPQLAWLLFLKSFDDFEYAHQEILGDSYVPVIEYPYRWRDWADVENKTERKTGDELIEFVNNELMPYMARLSGSSNADEQDIRSILGAVFQGTYNRIRSGYILREVVEKLSTINFNSSDDIHSISLFYETMLKEMRDAAGDAGEFYTPRPVVRFIVNRLAPQLSERMLDPACGTAGFLVEAYEQLREQARSPEKRRLLQRSLVGIEKKPMPYLLAVMNMRLHGIESPHLLERNALATNIQHIRDEERVDIIATNPPFGGEEERSIFNNFPDGMRTSETAILFFQYIMAMLKRPGGRCGVVLPNGFLFGNGVASIVKKRLLTRFNLHTIVRLPNGTFAPYTSIPTNILFFEACEMPEAFEEQPCTREIWYYELPLPEGRSSYSKTKPLQYEEFADCITWWDHREENEYAWKVSVEYLLAHDCNLDMKNPRGKKDFEHLPPKDLVRSILQKERRIVEIMHEIESLLEEGE